MDKKDIALISVEFIFYGYRAKWVLLSEHSFLRNVEGKRYSVTVTPGGITTYTERDPSLSVTKKIIKRSITHLKKSANG